MCKYLFSRDFLCHRGRSIVQEHLVLQFKAFLRQQGNAVSKVSGIDCLSCLSEKLFEGISFILVGLDGIPGSTIDSVGETDNEEIIHSCNLLSVYALIALSAAARDVRVQFTPGVIAAPLAMLAVARNKELPTMKY